MRAGPSTPTRKAEMTLFELLAAQPWPGVPLSLHFGPLFTLGEAKEAFPFMAGWRLVIPVRRA